MSQKKRRKGKAGEEQEEGSERTWKTPQKRGSLQAAWYLSAGRLAWASYKEEGAHTPQTEMPKP